MENFCLAPKAINDKRYHVTIFAVDGSTDPGIFFGRYDAPGKQTIAFGQVALLDSPKNSGGMTSGHLIGHETLEAYRTSKGYSLKDAHNYANRFYGGLEPKDNWFIPISAGDTAYGVIANWRVIGTRIVSAITLEFETPIPAQDLMNRGVKDVPQYPFSVETPGVKKPR